MISVYAVIVVMTILGSVAALFLKKATIKNKLANIFLGLLLYWIAALMNIYVLKVLDYSTVLPLTSLTYVWTLFLAKYVFDEVINGRKALGVVFVLIGSILVAK